MDELLSNLDAKLRVQMRSEIVSLHQELGSTTIYVTHDQTEAMTMATRIVVMKNGYIQQIGITIEIYDSPSNTFVAGFIGSPAMNIFDFKIKNNTITFKDFKVELDNTKVNRIKEYAKNEIKNKEIRIKELQSRLFDECDNSNFYFAKKNVYEERIKKYYESISLWNKYLNNEVIDIKFGIRPEDIITNVDFIKFNDLFSSYNALITVAEFLGHEYLYTLILILLTLQLKFLLLKI